MTHSWDSNAEHRVRDLQSNGNRRAVQIYGGAVFVRGEIESGNIDGFLNLLKNAVEHGSMYGFPRDEVIDTFCGICGIDRRIYGV